MKQLYLVFSMVLIVHVGAMAQQNELSASGTSTKRNSNVRLSTDQALLGVTGKVTDESGAAFPGVNILIKGVSASGTTTDANGKYNVDVPDGGTLIFSFVGYATQEIAVGGRTNIDVAMVLDVQSLSEIVVTALGISKDSKKLGYSQTTAKMDEMTSNRTNNMMTSLEGKVAGLDISPPSSGAAASNKIRIRGQTAFSGSDNGPLIVVNGLMMNQNAQGSGVNGNDRDRGDNLLLFNPDDIESMTVLKGATASALYGSRASNGAIIITTKNGSKSKGLGVEFTSNFAADQVLDYTDFQYEFGQGQNGARPKTQGEATSTGQFGWGERYDGVPTVQFDGVSRPYEVASKTRIEDFFNTGITSTNSIALSNGGPKGSFRVSYSNMDSKGITPNNTFFRKVLNLGLNQNLSDKLSVGLTMNYTNSKNNNAPQVGFQGQNYYNYIVRMSPTIP
ncbi:MAG TPA: TonB-dependent receptor plug domain-containing protein, partial [Cyclobacteriaceae bacterium]|nr:TonB-dependent receptor plug domain-containing protein [Cyclobacteriaceae bacterium]